MSERILTIGELAERSTLGVQTIRRLLRERPEALPRPIRLSERRLGWAESVVDAWIRDKAGIA